MNLGFDTLSPRWDVAGGWTCESVVFPSPLTHRPFRTVQSAADRALDHHGEGIAGGKTLALWYPADADAVVEQQIQLGNEEDPFWCYLWPTARTLAQQIFKARQMNLARSSRFESASQQSSPLHVLETGCGIGLVGLAALAAGATTVTFQDLRSRSVDLALHNSRVNGFDDRAVGKPWDWRSSPTQTFDWIMASDVLYHTPVHRPLLDFLENAIRAPHQNANVQSDNISTAHLLDNSPPSTSTPLMELANAIQGMIWIGDPGRREAETFIQLATPRFQIYLFDSKGMPLSSPQHGQYQLIVMHPVYSNPK